MNVVWEDRALQDTGHTCWNEHQQLITECKLKPEFKSDSKNVLYTVVKLQLHS